MVRKTSMLRGREPNRIGPDPIQVPKATPIRTVSISPTHKQPYDLPLQTSVPPYEAQSPYHGCLAGQAPLSPPLSPPVDHLDVFELDMESDCERLDGPPRWEGTTLPVRRPRAQTNMLPTPRMMQRTSTRCCSSSVGCGHAAPRRTSTPTFLPVVAPSHRQLGQLGQLDQDQGHHHARAMPIPIPTQRSTTRSSR